MSNPKIRKPSSSPKAILDACECAAMKKKSGGVEKRPEVLARIKEKAIKICEVSISYATKGSKVLGRAKLPECMDNYETPEARGRCLADVLWGSLKPGTPKSKGFVRYSPNYLAPIYPATLTIKR